MVDKTVLQGEEAHYMSGSIPRSLESKCPACREKVLADDMISEYGVSCPFCERVASITIIEDVGFISWTCGLEEGRLIISEMPEMPSELRDRLQEEYDLSEEEAYKLSTVREKSKFFEDFAEDIEPSIVSTFVVDLLTGELKYRDMKISEFKSDGLKDILKDYSDDDITEDSLEKVVRRSLDEDKTIKSVYDREEHLVKDDTELEDICKEVIEEESQAVKDYKQGDEKSINYLVGMVKKKTDGRADAKESRKIIEEQI